MAKITSRQIPLNVLVILALLALPRVIMHDLRIIPLDSALYKFFAVTPFLIWLGFAVMAKTSRPFKDFLTLGIIFGIFLAITHQITWDAAWGDNLPNLGGNLEGKLSYSTEKFIIRVGAFFSSLTTGAILGIIFGGVATLAHNMRGNHKRK